MSADCWSTVGRQSANSWPTVGCLTADRRPTGFARNIGYLATNNRKIENVENEQTANSLEWNILQVIAKKIN